MEEEILCLGTELYAWVNKSYNYNNSSQSQNATVGKTTGTQTNGKKVPGLVGLCCLAPTTQLRSRTSKEVASHPGKINGARNKRLPS